ncbi:hypothetical protein [Rouxiella chamberiensis]|uniref:Uncharacterized protein n=1 Tax=Rouxiella chamberiensis TaxID=1513468 RepID=A0ABY7HQL4_9GAMM|nr:hypothetical protein [Rouxiella chamberiensis]WAT01523.1 hypothetical protein O1V66_01695 [Rouxiella chamberiensis]
MVDSVDSDLRLAKIYSTNDFNLAQLKADRLCGNKSYYLKIVYDSEKDINSKYPDLVPYVGLPFSCDVKGAATAGNLEAKKIVEAEREKLYKDLDAAYRHQYEVHKAYAKKYGGDTYSVELPDGSIEAHSFDSDGSACHSSANQFGGETYCD